MPETLTPDAFGQAATSARLTVDLRPLVTFSRGHVSGAVNIPYRKEDFVLSVKDVTPEGPVALVDDIPMLTQSALTDLEAAGIPVVAVLSGGTRAWQEAGKPVETLGDLTVDELASSLRERPPEIIDVREPYELAEGTIPGAASIPLGTLPNRVRELDPSKEYVLVCASGSRSAAAQAYLHRHGLRKVRNLKGGMVLWAAAGHPTR